MAETLLLVTKMGQGAAVPASGWWKLGALLNRLPDIGVLLATHSGSYVTGAAAVSSRRGALGPGTCS